MGSMRSAGAFGSQAPVRNGTPPRAVSEAARAGRAMIVDVVLPTIDGAIRDDMDAKEIEALSMLVRGFSELNESNPELAYNVILDVLSGINDNRAIRQHISTKRGLFPHRRVSRRSEMTAQGLVVVEQEEEEAPAPLPPVDAPVPEEQRKSPIAELLYMRWLEGLRLKWPSIL